MQFNLMNFISNNFSYKYNCLSYKYLSNNLNIKQIYYLYLSEKISSIHVF